MADCSGVALRRLLFSAERFKESAIWRALRFLKTFFLQRKRVALRRYFRRPAFAVRFFLLRRHGSDAISELARPAFLCAMGAAIHNAARFDPVPDDAALAMRAFRREHVNRAFEAVEGVFLPVPPNCEGFVVIVPAHIAFGHTLKSHPAARMVAPHSFGKVRRLPS